MKTNRLVVALLAVCCTLTLASCEKEEAELPFAQNLYFEADMNGKSLLLPSGKDGYESKASAKTTTNAQGCAESQSMHLAKTADANKSVEITFVKQRSTCTTDCAQSKAMIQKGSYTFGKSASSDASAVDGVIVKYKDVYGKVWSTEFGTANQQTSSFTVTDVANNTTDDKSELFATIEFSCTLYDGEGNEIALTNGKFVSRSIVCK